LAFCLSPLRDFPFTLRLPLGFQCGQSFALGLRPRLLLRELPFTLRFALGLQSGQPLAL
jgi:hypothetical protein